MGSPNTEIGLRSDRKKNTQEADTFYKDIGTLLGRPLRGTALTRLSLKMSR